MLKYIFKRILTSIITIWAVITIVFFLVRIMPGGPFEGEKITPQMKEILNEKYGLDKPMGEQYTMYMKGLLQGDLGVSMKQKSIQVSDIIKNGFPKSMKVGVVAILVSLTFGILLGVIAALNANKWPDRICMLIATIGITIPSFVIGTLLIFIFTVKLNLITGTGLSRPENYIMPVIALAGSSIAFITRLIRNKLMDVLKSDYIRTAKAKGLTGFKVIFKHGLRNSLIPVVTYLGPLTAGVLTGSFVVENIFAITGLGKQFTSTITNRDYTALLGVLTFYCTFIVICNLVVDLIYVAVDPRIKLEG